MDRWAGTFVAWRQAGARDRSRAGASVLAAVALWAGAILAIASSARSDDLPAGKAAAVDRMRICALHGPGFFYIPGTDICVMIGGRARFEYIGLQQYGRGSNSSYRSEGRIAIEARSTTDFGLLRAVVHIDHRRSSGSSWFASASDARAGTAIGFQGTAGGFPRFDAQDTEGDELQTGINIDSAFVQWGGLTAGRVQSFFDFYADNDTWFGMADSDVVTQAFAYSYAFGNGFSATLSIEDPKERQGFPIAGLAEVAAGGINPSAATAPFTHVYPFAASPLAAPYLAPGGIGYAVRASIPDVVGVLKLDRDWGSAQLSGAYHRISTTGATVTSLMPGNAAAAGLVANPMVATVPGGYGKVTGDALAVQAGVKVNLPMLAQGDYLYLQGAYAKGAISYVSSGYVGTYAANGYAPAFDNLLAYDAVVGPSGRLTLTPAWSALVSLEHYWTPTVRQGLFASTAHIGYGRGIRTAAGFAAGAACPSCLGTVAVATPSGPAPYNPFSPNYDGGSIYYLGSNLIWSPVKNLDIGVELMYARDALQHTQWNLKRGDGSLTRDADAWLSRLRVQREF